MNTKRTALLLLIMTVTALLASIGLVGLVAIRAAEPARPVWFELPFTDARTGRDLTLAGFAGKTVIVETFATWCSNCRRQLNEVAKLYPELDAEKVVYLALGVDPNDDMRKIAQYAETSNYGWLFGVSSRELTAALVQQFGRGVTAVSSIPSFVIRPDGTFTDLRLGFNTVEEIKARIAEAQAVRLTPTIESVKATAEANAQATAAPTPMVDAAALPAWMKLEFTEARTGEPIRLADHLGKTIFVETFATWCANCRRQLAEVAKVYPEVDKDKVLFIALAVDPAENADQIRSFAERNGYEWLFGVSSRELTAALVQQFGRSITVVPSIPSFVIRPDGTFTDLKTGFNNVAALKQRIANNR